MHRVGSGDIRERHRAVILGQIEWRLHTCFAQRIRKCLNGGLAKGLQCRVQQGDVFPLQKPDAAKRMGKRDACIGND